MRGGSYDISRNKSSSAKFGVKNDSRKSNSLTIRSQYSEESFSTNSPRALSNQTWNESIVVDTDDNLSDTSRIRVVIRIRPFQPKEMNRNSKNILFPIGNQQISIWDPVGLDMQGNNVTSAEHSCWSRKFNFDHCLWSHDSEASNYATQDDVYEHVGAPIVKGMIEGFNCCVLAYGQTGAGKSYTMMGNINGDPKDFGLIPRICYGLFDYLEQTADDQNSEEVVFSYMEIYNEVVRDLLVDPKTYSNTNSGLRVREHPQQGVFVSNLTSIRVTSFEEVMSLIAIGDKNRTVAATNSNTQSSRSHGIVTLSLMQRTRQAMKDGLPTSTLKQKVSSRVHLVDLAGSERVTLSGAKGDRLKEANNINRSLSVLGDVIKSLGDLKGKKGHIPYRNSTLTMVLKDSLGGNSHVVMISAISPCSSDYEETTSTLKYADRAKKVRIRVEANVTSGILASDASAVELVPILQAEVQKLREMLRQQQLERDRQTSNVFTQQRSLLDQSNEAEKQRLIQMKERVEELESQLKEREKLIEDLKLSSLERTLLDQSSLDSESGNVDSSEVVTSQSFSKIPAYNELRRSLTTGLVNSTVSTINSPGDDSISNKGEANPLVSSISVDEGSLDSLTAETSELAAKLQSKATSAIGRPARRLVVLADDAVDSTLPRMINLNQDPLFSECLVYYMVSNSLTSPQSSRPQTSIVVGSEESDVDIFLTGPDIHSRHCVFSLHDTGIFIHPLGQSMVFVNGELLSAINMPASSAAPVGRKLSHNDRIAIGRFHLFRFEAPGLPFGHRDRFNVDKDKRIPGWEFAQEELLAKNTSIMSLKGNTNNGVTIVSPYSKKDQSILNMSPVMSKSPMPMFSMSRGNGNKIPTPSKGSTGALPLPPPKVAPIPQRSESPTSWKVSSNMSLNDSIMDDNKGNSRNKRVTFSFDEQEHGIKGILKKENVPKTNSALNAGQSPETDSDTNIASPSIDHDTFEREAVALQKELADMQMALQARIQRFQAITSKPAPGL